MMRELPLRLLLATLLLAVCGMTSGFASLGAESSKSVGFDAPFTAGEGAFMAAEEKLGTGGTYAASTALILGNIRSVKNVPLRLLTKQLDDDIVSNSSRGAQLRAKYAHYTPAQRQARIEELAMGNRVLREAGVEGKYISEALQSFEPGTITTRIAGSNDFGLRFFGGVSGPKSPYLALTFQGGNIRALSAVPEGNTLQNLMQWRIREGTPLLEGRIRSAFGQPGGGQQIYVPQFWVNLITP